MPRSNVMESWLRCSVRQGQFPGEYAVAFATSNGQGVSMFASGEFVQPEENLLRVEVLDRSQDAALIYLPARPFEVPSRTVLVPAKELFARR